MSDTLLFFDRFILGHDLKTILQLLATAYCAVLFLQSGLDKATDWSGNKSYLNSVFGKSILRGAVPLLLPAITALELSAGACSALGVVMLLLGKGPEWAIAGLLLGATAILCLFGGMRIAKDYGGAAAITPYFIFHIFALAVFT